MWPRSALSSGRRHSRATCPRGGLPRSTQSTPLEQSSVERLRVFGRMGRVRMSVIAFVDSAARDLRYALRGLSRRPAFTFAAVATLALGIGATTAIFSVVYSVLIKPLSYPSSHELVRIRHVGDRGNISASREMYFTYRAENRTFAEVGIWQGGTTTLTDNGGARRVRSLLVMDGTLQALGVQPARGRWFAEAEHGPAAEGPPPVILSHAFWQREL